MISNPNSADWREAIVASAVLSDPANLAAIKAKAIAAASTDYDDAAVALTADLAFDAKTRAKFAFDDAIEDFFGSDVTVGAGSQSVTDFTRAILFARGGVNVKEAGPLMALALKYGTSTSEAEILAVAKSLDKKNGLLREIQYAVAKDALSQPEQLFDLVDHTIFTTGIKTAPNILAVAVAARPEFAHYAARAAALRAPTAATGDAAIRHTHMFSDRNVAAADISSPDDPAAVAAISAATILGILDAKLLTVPVNREELAIRTATRGLVKASLLLESGDASLQQYSTIGGPALKKSRGTAGVVTGIVSQLQGYNGNSFSSLTPLAGAALTTAAFAGRAHSDEIAQAAGQSAQWVYQQSGGIGQMSPAFIAQITAALTDGGATGNVSAAVTYGVTQAYGGGVVANRAVGAGAGGIRDYNHYSGLNAPVVTLENF